MKKIMITGASDGIGLELARQLARKGNQIMLVSRNKEKLANVLTTLAGSGHNFMVADLSKKDDIHMVADHLSRDHFDVLINNAGVGSYGTFVELPLDQQMKMIQLNIYALTVLSHSYLKTARAGDSLVNVSSTLGTTSFPGQAAYSGTKAFVTNFSESLWWENKRRDVYVMGFCPGVTQTSFHLSGGDEAHTMFPKFIIQSPAAVAEKLIRSLADRRKPKVVSGIPNRFMLFFHRFLSRKMVVNMMGNFSPIRKSDEKQIRTVSVG